MQSWHSLWMDSCFTPILSVVSIGLFYLHVFVKMTFCQLGGYDHSVLYTSAQLTEGRSARDQPKQPPAKKKGFYHPPFCETCVRESGTRHGRSLHTILGYTTPLQQLMVNKQRIWTGVLLPRPLMIVFAERVGVVTPLDTGQGGAPFR